MITATNLYYKYPKGSFDIRIGRLELAQGETAFITGDNGSGKSTLSKLLTGIIKPNGGFVYIDGNDVGNMPLGQVGKHIGYLWQKPELQLFARNALDELLWPLEIFHPGRSNADKQQDSLKAGAMLADFGLSHLSGKSSFLMSKGEKQRLAICGVLFRNAKYLILDEPSTGLDSANIEILIHMLVKAKEAYGTGMCIISHDTKLRQRLAERVIHISGGRIAYDSAHRY